MSFSRMLIPFRVLALPLLFAINAFGQSPEWIEVPALRQVSTRIGTVLADIDSRLPATSNQYTFSSSTYRDADLSCWAHEATHGVNARIRNQYGDSTGVDNGFYVLHGRGVLIREPCPLTFPEVSRQVPLALRAQGYPLYMVQQAQVWREHPLNIVDEWTAYVNGAYATMEYEATGRPHHGSHDVARAVEMGIYTLVLARQIAIGIHKQTLAYDDTQFRFYTGWHWCRTRDLMAKSAKYPRLQGGDPMALLDKLRLSRDAQTANLRDWLRVYFGKAWCQAVLDF